MKGYVYANVHLELEFVLLYIERENGLNLKFIQFHLDKKISKWNWMF